MQLKKKFPQIIKIKNLPLILRPPTVSLRVKGVVSLVWGLRFFENPI